MTQEIAHTAMAERAWLNRRAAGILLHPTALAGEAGLDEGIVRQFVGWMGQAGLTLWQILPIHPPEVVSPYQAVSSFTIHAGLFAKEWLAALAPTKEEVSQALSGAPCSADEPFLSSPLAPFAEVIASERRHAVAFAVLRAAEPDRPFWHWPTTWHPDSPGFWPWLRRAFADALSQAMAQQLAAERVWQVVRQIAHEAGVWIIGDLPFFVAANSADVWSHRAYFQVEASGAPRFVAGVPPDYFSATGQRWGNPQYDWDALGAEDYRWFRARVAATLAWCDGLRLDHFRGFDAVWSIPADAPTAEAGQWRPVPGRVLLTYLIHDLGESALPFIAEDLGIITDGVKALKAEFHLPGISVLQFGFDGLPGNPHAPHAIGEWQLAVTGTHDNDTTLGWWQSLGDEGYRQWILAQLPASDDPMPWPLIDAALASPARWAVIPVADWLGLGSEARFNTPGTVDDQNWRWVVPPGALDESLALYIRARLERYGRLVDKEQP